MAVTPVDGRRCDDSNLRHSTGQRPSRRVPGALPAMASEGRFLTLEDVADVLNISTSQAYALVRNRELDAIKIGGRGQWRVERDRLEDYIARMYQQTREFID